MHPLDVLEDLNKSSTIEQLSEKNSVLGRVVRLLASWEIEKIKKASNAYILDAYVKHYHEHIRSFGDYVEARRNREVPALETIVRCIRKARELIPQWRRDKQATKEATIDVMKEIQ